MYKRNDNTWISTLLRIALALPLILRKHQTFLETGDLSRFGRHFGVLIRSVIAIVINVVSGKL